MYQRVNIVAHGWIHREPPCRTDSTGRVVRVQDSSISRNRSGRHVAQKCNGRKNLIKRISALLESYGSSANFTGLPLALNYPVTNASVRGLLCPPLHGIHKIAP